ncbi:MAG: hypothetical protein PHW19_06580 [Salinivirgaceae bacterium]|nr:hypothetical protein [Salinivirgaceae bacterium]
MLVRGLKIFAITFFLVAIVAVVIMTRKDSASHVPPLAIFDDSTEIVVRVNSPKNFFQSFEINPSSAYFKAQFTDTASLPGFISAEFYEKSKEIYYSYHPKYGSNWVLSFVNASGADDWIRDFVKSLPERNTVTKKRESGNLIYGITISKDKTIGVTENSGLIIISDNVEKSRAMAKAIAQLNFDPESLNNQVQKVNKFASTDAAANLFINNREQSVTDFPFFMDTGWAVLDLWTKNNTLLINGLSGGENKKGYVKDIDGHTPQKTSIEKLIPAFANNYYHLAYNETLPIGGKYLAKSDQRFKKHYGIDMREFITRIYDGEIVRFTTKDEHSVVGFKIKGASTTEFNLKNMVEFAVNQKISAREVKYKFDDQTHFSIFESAWGNFTGELFGSAFAVQEAKCIGIVSGFLLVAENSDLLRKTMNAIILHQSYDGSMDYQKVIEQKASSANLSLYQQRGSKTDLLSFWVSEQPLAKLRETLNQFPFGILWQVSADMEKPYHNIVVNFGQQNTKTNKVFEWKSRLQGSSVMKPIIVKNHTTNSSEIIVQDSANIIYLLNRQGRVLWQKQLDGLILSEVYQVDRYKNGFLQLLFNTANRIYLIDRNGDDTDKYPLELKSNASAGLSLFDYDDNKNYRIVMPHVDRSLSMIDIDANSIEGWSFTTTDGIVTTPVQHFRIGVKDYLLMGDNLRIYILDRRGDQRIKPSELKGKSKNNPFYYSNLRNRWFTTTTQGQLMSISIDGTVRREELFKLSPDHYYLYADFSPDGKGNHVFVDKNQLIVANQTGGKLFSYVFRGSIVDMPALYRFSSKSRGLGIVDREDRKVFLFDSNGKQFSMFPQHGITPFTITRYESEPNFHLLVGHIDGFIYDIKID